MTLAGRSETLCDGVQNFGGRLESPTKSHTLQSAASLIRQSLAKYATSLPFRSKQ